MGSPVIVGHKNSTLLKYFYAPMGWIYNPSGVVTDRDIYQIVRKQVGRVFILTN